MRYLLFLTMRGELKKLKSNRHITKDIIIAGMFVV